VSFTHDTQWDYLLPGIPPTDKRAELPHVVVMKFENGKVAHEHIWWDQASLLVLTGGQPTSTCACHNPCLFFVSHQARNSSDR
jgi:hypothetical protein